MANSKSILGVHPKNLVIGGLSVSSIKYAMGGESFKIQGIRPQNAFCIKVNEYHYIYVRNTYTLYRKAMKLMCGNISNAHDIDHVLAKRLATSIGVRYILLSMVDRSANRSHGSIEKLAVIRDGIYLNKVFYMDERIYNKIFSEKIRIGIQEAQYKLSSKRYDKLDFRYGYKFNSALGLDKVDPNFINLLSPYSPHVKT